MHRSEMRLIVELGVNALDIMVVHKVVELEAVRIVAAHLVQTLYSVRDLKEVVVVVAGIQCLVQLVIGDRVQCAFIYPARVIAVDDFTHQPKFRLNFVCDMAQRLHKVKVKHIRSVKTNAVHVKLADPEADNITDVVLHGRIALVELHEQVVTAPVVVAEPVVVLVVAAKVHIAVPVSVLRAFTFFLDVFECKEIAPGVVEHAVKNYFDVLLMALCHEIFQILIVAEAAVELFVVGRLIAVSDRFKQWSDIDGVAANAFDVVNPRQQCI